MSFLARIADKVLNRPLLIHPQKAEVIMMVLGGRIGIDAPAPSPEANRFVGQPKIAGRSLLYNVVDGVAVITIEGSLVNRGDWIGADSGVVSYEGIEAQMSAAAVDQNVRAIVLDVDSPGGEATGMYALAGKMRSLRSQRPIVTLVNDLAASAAYGLAAQSDRIVVSPTSIVGSIGVVMMHLDVSKRMEQLGQAATLIYAGAHKVDGHPFAPLPDGVREDLQRDVETFYDRFVETVEAGREGRISDAAIRGTEARTFIGAEAIRLGLADDLGGLAEAVAIANDLASGLGANGARSAGRTNTTSFRRLPAAGFNQVETTMEWKDINAEGLRQHRPDLVATLEASDAFKAKLEEARAEGAEESARTNAEASAAAATAERERILAIQGSAFAGQEALVAELIGDPKISAGDAALRLNAAERQKGQAHLAALADADRHVSGVKPAPTAPVTPPAGSGASAQTPEAWEAEYSSSAKLQGEFAAASDYVAYRKNEARIRTRERPAT